jgi:hypothetical protein
MSLRSHAGSDDDGPAVGAEVRDAVPLDDETALASTAASTLACSFADARARRP